MRLNTYKFTEYKWDQSEYMQDETEYKKVGWM